MKISLRLLVTIIPALLIVSLSACHSSQGDSPSSDNDQAQQVITVKKQPVYRSLYFSGNLAPSTQVSVTSPNDGVIIKKYFQYGSLVKKGQPLVVIESTKQAQDFQDALSSYLKAKEQLNTDQGTLQSTQMLFKKGLVSKDEFKQAQSAYYLSRLSLLQAEGQLKKALRYYNFYDDIFSLSISDIKSISKTIAKSLKAEELHINSPSVGIILLPSNSPSNDSSSDPNNGKISVGSQVKQGQALVTIGLLRGLAINAKANEVDVNQLKTGLKATITSVAFPDLTLTGKITAIASQATQSNSLPEFAVTIMTPPLTPAQAKVIKIGMSAKAAVRIKLPAHITVPIAAVYQNKQTGQSMVTQVINGKDKPVAVETGQTSLGTVVILSGLKSGDKIVASHQPQ